MDAEKSQDLSVADELRPLTLELQDAVRSHDRARLDVLVAEEFALAGSSRLNALDKQRWIDAALEARWASFDLLEFHVTAHGDIATVIHRLQQSGTWGDEDISSTWLVADTWWRSSRGWRLAGRCARRLAEDA